LKKTNKTPSAKNKLAVSEPATVRWTMKENIELKHKNKRRKSHAEKVFSGN